MFEQEKTEVDPHIFDGAKATNHRGVQLFSGLWQTEGGKLNKVQLTLKITCMFLLLM